MSHSETFLKDVTECCKAISESTIKTQDELIPSLYAFVEALVNEYISLGISK